MGLEQRFGFQTTQAVDLISGGVKINALPEQASAVINHRIEVTVSTADAVRRWRGETGQGKLTFKDGMGRDVVVPVSFRGLAQALDALAKQ